MFQDSISAEYYQNIARIVDQTITNANRLLRELGPKKANANELACNKTEPPPANELACNKAEPAPEKETKESKENAGVLPSSSGAFLFI